MLFSSLCVCDSWVIMCPWRQHINQHTDAITPDFMVAPERPGGIQRSQATNPSITVLKISVCWKTPASLRDLCEKQTKQKQETMSELWNISKRNFEYLDRIYWQPCEWQCKSILWGLAIDCPEVWYTLILRLASTHLWKPISTGHWGTWPC